MVAMANPYVYQTPIVGRAGFFGRHSELTRISSRIAADRPQSVSVVGTPRSGKTSMLNWLNDAGSRAEYLGDPAQYVFLFLRLRAQPPGDPPSFFAQLDAALRQGSHGGMAATYSGFDGLVRRLMQEGRKLVVCCDDFEQVTANQGFPLDFFSFMRSIANSNNVGYLTTSPLPLQQLCHTEDIEESPFFNIFTTVNLEPFDEEEARRLVEEPARQTGAPFAGEVEWILRLAGAWPYFLQLTASAAFEARARGALNEKTLEERAFKEAKGFLERLWGEHFPEAQQEVMRAVCAGKGVEPRHQYAAETLERRGYLRREGEGYTFRVGLLERFVREQGQWGFWRRWFR
jgi:serine/threonine-protein kinase